MNAATPEKGETVIMWELHVLMALALPCVEHGEDMTLIIIDKVCITEGQFCKAKCMGQKTPASHHICPKYEHSTYTCG